MARRDRSAARAPRNGAVVAEDCRASSRATGCLRAIWWHWRAISSAVTLVTVASFDTWD